MAFLKFLAFMVSSVGSTIFSGYVLAILWGWFIVEQFNAPALGLNAAIGFALVVSYMTHQYRKPDDNETGFVLFFAWMKPTMCLLVGWIILQFS